MAFLASCTFSPQPKKQYDFEIIYSNGDTLETSYVGIGDNYFSLENGDLTTRRRTVTLVSGVRTFRVLSIKTVGMQTQAEANTCDCDLKQVTN